MICKYKENTEWLNQSIWYSLSGHKKNRDVNIESTYDGCDEISFILIRRVKC